MTVANRHSITVSPTSSVPLYAQVVEQLTQRILGGSLPAGTPLPSVRQLAEELAINSLTVQKSYKILETNGLVEIRKGIGAFVAEGVATKEDRHEALRKVLEPAVESAKRLGADEKTLLQLIGEIWNGTR